MSRLLAFLLLSFAAIEAGAQSFDCAAAATGVERAICADPELAALDESLAETYRSITDSMPETQRENAAALQQLWLQSRDSRCEGDPNGIASCVRSVYEEWLRMGRAGILFAEDHLENREWHDSPLIPDWRFQYVEIEQAPGDLERRYTSELNLHVGDQQYQLAYNDNEVYGPVSYRRSLPNAVGYFLTRYGHLHVGFVRHYQSDGGACGWHDRRVFHFLYRHANTPKDFHQLSLSDEAECVGPTAGLRTVSAIEDGALEIMEPLAGPSHDRLTAPWVTRVDSETGTVTEHVRVDSSTSHFEGEPYEDLIARTLDSIQTIESWAHNSELNDCGVPTRATHNYRSLRVGSVQQSLIDEGRPFGFLQLQHYVFNVLTPEHVEPVRHYKPFIDGALRYLDGMRRFDDWESRLVEAADRYPGRSPGVYDYEVVDWPGNPFADAGFPTDPCFTGAQSIWWAVDLEEWIYLFWARRLADGNLDVTEQLLRRISAAME